MFKPYSSAPLSDHHLRVGLLVSFANEVNRGLERKDQNPMGNLYVFDDKSEIRVPKEVPENWPTGLVRIYAEQARSTADVEFRLCNFDPAMNTAGYDAKRGGSLDQQGVRFTGQNGWCGLKAHYLVIPEFEQLSFVPLIGDHTQDIEAILEQAKLGGYDRKLIRAAYEDSKITEAYEAEDDLEHFSGVPHTYHNWLMLNALIISKIVTLRQIALAEHGDNVTREVLERDERGNVIPIDVSVEDPAQALEHKPA